LVTRSIVQASSMPLITTPEARKEIEQASEGIEA
jgi:hypothetical protein